MPASLVHWGSRMMHPKWRRLLGEEDNLKAWGRGDSTGITCVGRILSANACIYFICMYSHTAFPKVLSVSYVVWWIFSPSYLKKKGNSYGFSTFTFLNDFLFHIFFGVKEHEQNSFLYLKTESSESHWVLYLRRDMLRGGNAIHFQP